MSNKNKDSKSLGTLINSKDVIWIIGSYLGSKDMEDNKISKEIPLFATVPQEYEEENVKEMLLIFTEEQKALLLMSNLQLDEETTTFSLFTEGTEDIFNEAFFYGLRLGTFYYGKGKKYNRFESKTPKYKATLQQPIIEASSEEIKMFLQSTDYTFIRFFRSNLDQFLIILENLFKKLVKYPDFNKDLFIQRFTEISGGLPDEIVSDMIKNMEEIAGTQEGIIGYVTGMEKDRIEIITSKIIDASSFPIFAIDCGAGKTAIIIVESIEGMKIIGRRAYAIHESEMIGSLISIMKGYPARYVNWDDIKIALEPETNKDIEPIKIPVGKIIGISESKGQHNIDLNNKQTQELFKNRADGHSVSIPGEYQITINPGDLANGIIVGDSGSGKSNGIKVFITGVITSNRYSTSQKCGLLIFDRGGEYSGMYGPLTKDPNYRDLVQVINVSNDPLGKFKLEDLNLKYYANERSEETYDQDLRVILNHLYDTNTTPQPDKYFKNNPRLTIEALNFLWDINHINSIMEVLERTRNLHPARVRAMHRRFTRLIENLLPILQIKKNDRDEFELEGGAKNLKSVLFKAQKEGTVLILNISRIAQSKTYGIFTEMVQRYIQNVREKWFNDELEKSGGDQIEFTKKAPMFLKINEEATYLFASMRDQREITSHVRDATGARKYNLGTLYVFQTLQGISSNISLILSQLGGFNIVFALTMEQNLKKGIENISIQGVSYLKQFIKSAKRFKNCLTSCEAYDQRPFFVKFYYAEDYFKTLFNIDTEYKTKSDLKHDQKKKDKEGEPEELKAPKKKKTKNLFEEQKKRSKADETN